MSDPMPLVRLSFDFEDFLSPATKRAQLLDPALDFLQERHGEAAWRALRLGFLGGLEQEEVEKIPDLPVPIPSAIAMRGDEWLLSEAMIELPEGPVAVYELLLGPSGPRLTAEARAWLAALAGEPLALHEVGARTPDGHLCLRNALHPRRPMRRVQEDPLTTDGLARGEIIGARVVRWEGDDVIAGAIYPFRKKAVKFLGGVRAEARDVEPGVCRLPGEGERLVELFVSQAMAWLWVQGVVRGGS
jgi:hypothetical protein